MKTKTDSGIKDAASDSVEALEQDALQENVAALLGYRRDTWSGCWKQPNGYATRRLPDYPNDLNACHEFEKAAPIGYWKRLGDITGAGGHSISLQQWKRIGLATGTERCRAYIYEMEATP